MKVHFRTILLTMASETLMYTLWRESTLYGMKAHFTE